jgi:hypothetical protein
MFVKYLKTSQAIDMKMIYEYGCHFMLHGILDPGNQLFGSLILYRSIKNICHSIIEIHGPIARHFTPGLCLKEGNMSVYCSPFMNQNEIFGLK